jgi:long-chain fatty acid transport protein
MFSPRFAVTLLVAGFATAPAAAQSIFDRFEFSFSNPGARSLGFGGAFAALADDATAAYTNPAGLVQLTKPEVSLELRLRRQGSALSAGAEREASSSAGGSFGAVVVPRGPWSFALYGHQLARFDVASEFRVLFPSIFGVPELSARVREQVNLDVVLIGGAASRRFGDHFSLGLAVAHTNVSLSSSAELFSSDSEREQDRLGRASLEIDRGVWTIQAGALHRISDRWSLGYFLRQGTDAEGPARFEPAPNPPFRVTLPSTARVRVPFVSGLGLAYRSKGGAVTLAAEVDRVDYDTPFKLVTFDLFEDELRDFIEYHVGGEYAFLRSNPLVALRAGYWVKSDELGSSDLREERYSVGLGFVFRRVQLDFAFETGEDSTLSSLSAIYTF